MTRRPIRCLAGTIVPASVAFVACGGPGASNPAAQVIEVVMTDHAFAPASIQVEQGTFAIVRFRNEGTVRHEGTIGDALFQAGHEEHEHAGMENSVNAVLIEPGATGDVPYRFDVAGEILIGCHEPGHWDAGMVATVDVVPAG